MGGEKRPSIAEMAEQHRAKLEQMKNYLTFKLVKDHGLSASSEVFIVGAQANTIAKIILREKGLINTFTFSGIQFELTTETLNDDDARVREAEMTKNHRAAITDYVDDHPEQFIIDTYN